MREPQGLTIYRTRYIVDTDVIINYLSGKDKAKGFLMRIINGEVEGFFSVITEAELLSGAGDPKDEVNIIYIPEPKIRL